MQRVSLIRLQATQRYGRSVLGRLYSTGGAPAGSASEQLVRLEADHLPDGRPSGIVPPAPRVLRGTALMLGVKACT
jgi:hypothetical protein